MDTASEPPPPLSNANPRHLAEVGDRYKVPRSEFFDDGCPDELLFGVVS